jgi:hypothetical protein
LEKYPEHREECRGDEVLCRQRRTAFIGFQIVKITKELDGWSSTFRLRRAPI